MKARTLATAVTLAFVFGIAQFLSNTEVKAQYPAGGGPYVTKSSIINIVTNNTFNTFNVSNLFATNINAYTANFNTVVVTNNITIKGNATISSLNVTNVVIQGALWYPTNGVSSATAIDFQSPEATTNITANIAFTSLANVVNTNYNSAIRHIVNNSGGNLTLTVAASWKTDPITRTTATTYTLTNNSITDLLVQAQVNQYTSAVVIISTP